MPKPNAETGDNTCIWLNVDADLELENPDGYEPSARMLAQIRQRAAFLERRLRATPEHASTVVLYPGCEPLDCSGSRGDAWCPTPRARAALRKLGAALAEAPPLDVLRRVNHRAFSANLGQWLPHARFVRTIAELEDRLAQPATSGWLLKRPFGFSGRARKRVAGLPLDEGTRTWATASMQSYGIGLQVEPWVDIECEFAIHGFVKASGPHVLRDLKVLETDDDGGWLRNRAVRDGELPDDERFVLQETAHDTVVALAEAGYFGPFCIDAFRWRDAHGRSRLQPRSEINARYSMGFW